jgi:hypothetical protein
MEELPADVGKQTPIGNVQVDAFCAGCNYNLFSQVVSLDERLGILVCRCPECGRFTAAGSMTTANQKLNQRLATGALVIYIGFLLGVSTFAAGFLAGMQGTYLDDRFNIDFPAAAHVEISAWQELVIGAIAGALFGGFLSTFCWHWRRGWRYLGAVIPLLLSVLVWNLWRTTGYSQNPKPRLGHWGLSVLAIVVGLQTLCVLVGEALGRPTARLALQILLPARLRQYLSFLWFADGKVPPVPHSAVGAPSRV